MSRSRVATARNWEPNPSASFALALLAALLATIAFLILLHQPELSAMRSDAVSIVLLKHAPMGQNVQKPQHHPAASSPKPHVTHALPEPAVKLPALAQGLDLGIPPLSANPPAFDAPRAAPVDRNLGRSLNLPVKAAPALQNNHAVRNIDGKTVIRSGNLCGSIETLQMSPSPTNKASVGRFTPCPGEYQPSLGDQLLDWAKNKQEKSALPPP